MLSSSYLPLSRRYAAVVAACALPLVLIIGGLAYFQSESLRRAQLETFASDLAEAKLVVDGVTKEALDHVSQLKAQAEDILSGRIDAGSAQLSALLTAPRMRSGEPVADALTLDGIKGTPFEPRLGTLLAAPSRLGRAEPHELDMALALFEPMRLTHQVSPYLRWSYYFSASGAFITMFPFVTQEELVAGYGHKSVADMVDSYLTYDVFVGVSPAKDDASRPYWSPVYLDAAGSGWMVSHTAAVSGERGFAGVVGTDLLLSFLDDTLGRIPMSVGQLWIVNPKGELVADRARTPIEGESTRHLSDVLPPALAQADPEFRTILATGQTHLAGHNVFSVPVAGTPWSLVYVVSDREVNGMLAGRLLPYGVILLALVVMLIAAHQILRRQFIWPAMALVDHLNAESVGGNPRRKDVPKLWRPWTDLVTNIFAENRAAMRKLAASEARYRNVVEVQSDFILRVDPSGRISFVNDAYCRRIGRQRENLLGMRLTDFIVLSPEDRKAYEALFVTLTPDNPISQTEIRSTSPDGRVLHTHWTDCGIFDDGGKLVEIQSVGRDVTEQKRIAEALAASEERYRNVVEAQTEYVVRFDAQGRMSFANDAYCRLVGKTTEELLSPGWHYMDAYDPDLGAGFAEIIGRVSAANPVRHTDAWGRLRDGRIVHIGWTDRGMFDADGRLLEIQAVGRDVTEQKRAVEALEASEQRYRSVVETQTEFVVRQRPDGHLTFVNEAYCRASGMTREQLLDPNWCDFDRLPEEERARLLVYLAQLTPENPTGTIELRNSDARLDMRWSSWTDQGFFDESGRLIETQAVGRDITEQKRALEALEASEERYRSVVEAQTEFVLRMTPDGYLTFVNEAYCRYCNMTREQMLDPDYCDLDQLPRDERQRFATHIARLTPDNPVASIELKNHQMLRGTSWSAWTDRGIFDESGKLVEVQSVGRDITQRVRAEQAREEAERLRRTVLEAALDGYVSIDSEGRIVEFNPAAERIFGHSSEDVLGRPMVDLIVPAHSRNRHMVGFTRHLETGQTSIIGKTLEVTALHADGHEFPIEIVIVRSELGNSPIFIAYLRDLTEQKKAEAEIAESAARFRAIAEGVPLPIIITVLDEPEVLFANERARQMLGLEVGQRGAVALLSWHDPSRRREIARMLAEEGAVDAFEAAMRTPAGETLDVLISARRIQHEGRVAMFAAVTDITEQRRAEAEITRQRENLHQSEKLSALGSLLAGVAHELNNPLSVVIGYSSMLKEFATDPAVSLRADKIHDAAERCSRIVRTFLAMARKKPPSRGPLDIAEVIAASLELTAYGLRSAGVEVVTKIPDGLPPVYGDADQLPQVFTNLLVNAQQALLSVPAPRRLTIVACQEARGVEIVVADNGPGMKADVAKRIFEPFFTTKPAGVGTGVGLSVCQAIVTAHDGRISVESSEGKGARFTIFLPCVDSAAAAPAADAGAQPQLSRHARVLVVDDEPDIAAMIAEMLRHDGHEAEVAGSAEAALAAVRGGGVDLVVSDIRMPGLDGPGFYRALEGAAEGLADRVLFVTGDTLAPEIDRFISDTGAPVIEKPIDPILFRKAIAERLAEMTRSPS
ncbi:PAS domain S-box protein [Mesorhizobium sp. IMUNJ 23232]|uniref:PAS domain S-box protein n=1 Tax=Mesorhizobium sp. IMUNJ 23232 TaxID=3376064 RepID=UPI00379876D4